MAAQVAFLCNFLSQFFPGIRELLPPYTHNHHMPWLKKKKKRCIQFKQFRQVSLILALMLKCRKTLLLLALHILALSGPSSPEKPLFWEQLSNEHTSKQQVAEPKDKAENMEQLPCSVGSVFQMRVFVLTCFPSSLYNTLFSLCFLDINLHVLYKECSQYESPGDNTAVLSCWCSSWLAQGYSHLHSPEKKIRDNRDS